MNGNAIEATNNSTAAATIYANAFLIGAVLMGFEMLGSRYLFPYFGGDIGTWVMRTPAAFDTALAIAASGGTIEVSPTPRTP